MGSGLLQKHDAQLPGQLPRNTGDVSPCNRKCWTGIGGLAEALLGLAIACTGHLRVMRAMTLGCLMTSARCRCWTTLLMWLLHPRYAWSFLPQRNHLLNVCYTVDCPKLVDSWTMFP